MITKKIKHKDSTGVVHEYDIGADAKNISEDTTHRFVSDDEKKSWNGKMDPSGNASDSTVAFQQAASRANILTGEKMTGLFGKIAKWFSDLKNHSFADLIQNASTADTTRAVSAAVAKNLQDQITAQNTKTFQKGGQIVVDGIPKGDLNNYLNGTYFYTNDGNYTNIPPIKNVGILIAFSTTNGFVMQIAKDVIIDDSKLYIRVRNAQKWTAWKACSLV